MRTKYKLDINEEGYVIGYYCSPEGEVEIIPEDLFTDNLHPMYQFIKGKLVYSPQPYTPEQTEQLRKEYCQAEIRKTYSAEAEMKTLRENMINTTSGQGDTREFSDYNSNVKNIIKESKIKNFQIEEAKNENQNNF